MHVNYHVNRCLQQNGFNALRKNTIHKAKKPRKLDTVANPTPEQIERKRASRRGYYYNHKEQFNAYVKQRYSIDPIYWETNSIRLRIDTENHVNMLKKEALKKT